MLQRSIEEIQYVHTALWLHVSAVKAEREEMVSISSHLHSLHVVPLRFLPNLLLHVVSALCHFRAHTRGPIATEVSSRVILIDLWTSLLIIGYQNHAWRERKEREGGREGEREGGRERERERGGGV